MGYATIQTGFGGAGGNIEGGIIGSRKGDMVTEREAYACFRPGGFHILAGEYLLGAEDVRVRFGFPLVKCFLYCRSIELSLKAFLLAKNVPVSRLRGKKGIGHDLVKGLEEAELQGLGDVVRASRIYKKELRKANAYYATKQGFEYMDDCDVLMKWRGVSDFPDIEVLREFARTLVEGLGAICVRSVVDSIGKARDG